MPGYWNTDDQGGGPAPPSYPVSSSPPSGGNGGGQGPHWDPPSQLPPEPVFTPPPSIPPGEVGGPGPVIYPPVDTTGGDDIGGGIIDVDDALAIGATSTPTTTQSETPWITMPLMTGDNLTPEQEKWNRLIALQNLWESGASGWNPDTEAGLGDILDSSAPFGLAGGPGNTNPYGLIYHTGGVGENTPGAVLLEPETEWSPAVYGQPVMSGLGEHLLESDWGNQPGGMPTPEQIMAMGTTATPGSLLGSLQDITRDYYRNRFDESFAMDPFYDEWDYQYGSGGGGGEEEMERFLGGKWASGPAPTEMVSMGEMKPIFGEELDPGREASWLYLTGVPHFSDTTHYNYS